MRVASLDIGTNSTRLLIAEANGKLITKELFRRASITRLGRGVSMTGRLLPEAIEKTNNILATYSQISKDYHAEIVKAVATNAVRDADNADEFLTGAEEILSSRPEVISGTKEAHLGYLGVLSDVHVHRLGSSFLVVDIGGGSTEITHGDSESPASSYSLPVGSVRLFEEFFQSDPPAPSDISTLQLHVSRILRTTVQNKPSSGCVPIAVAGTACSLAAIALELPAYDPEKVHLFDMSAEKVLELLDRLSSMPLADRQKVVGLEPARADVIVSGAAIFAEILSFFDFDHVIISERDLLDGLIVSDDISGEEAR